MIHYLCRRLLFQTPHAYRKLASRVASAAIAAIGTAAAGESSRRPPATALIWAMLLLVGPTMALAAKEQAEPAAALPQVIANLVAPDPDGRLDAATALRADPIAARAALLDALQREDPVPERWRLVFRLSEFGQSEDIPLLLALRGASADAWERRVIEGVLQALYDPARQGDDLVPVVEDFSFIQTRPPTEIPDPDSGAWILSAWSFRVYHRNGVPLRVIRKIGSLRGVSHSSKERLEEAIAKRLNGKERQLHQESLLAAAEEVPALVGLQGLARVRLFNPLERPLLLTVSLDAWFGTFQEPPEVAWVYLEPGASGTVDLPAALRGSLRRPHIRLDLRLSEVNGALISNFHKLYLPIRP